MEQIQLGAKGRYEMAVNRMVSAAAVKDGLLEVFGTPFLVMMMENASIEALSPFLEEGEGSVGTRMDVTHSAATPLGMKVWAVAEIAAINGKMITLKVDAWDEKGPIGSAIHERAIIRPGAFFERVKKKAE